MTDNRRYNHFVIIALILTVGLGLALALPWLANSQSLAADEIPNDPLDFAEVVRSAELAYALAIDGNGNAPISLDLCFATHNDGADVYSSLDSRAVQQAVDAASAGDTVKVAGTCIGVENRAGLAQTVYISKTLRLEGGHTRSDWSLDSDHDIYPTVVHASTDGRVIVISGTMDVTLEGLFLVGGRADDGTLDDNGGGIWSNSEFTLANSIVYSNTANDGGGMYNLGVSPMLTNVTFSDNLAKLTGGAMMNYGFQVTSSPILNNVVFSGNWAYYGGAMHNFGRSGGTSSPILTNVTFSGNSVNANGGAMYNVGQSGTSSPILTNVTFSGNLAQGSGGAMHNHSSSNGTSSPQVRNSILWNNQDRSGTGTIGANIYNNQASITLTHSLVEGSGGTGINWIGGDYKDGGGNIDQDPMFITPIDPSTAPTTTGNLRLKTGSPAIDAGDNTYIVDFPTDLDGEPRIVDGNWDGTPTVDMGAYEAMGYYQLTVSKTGTGEGLVTSSPAGIDCGDTCSVYLQEDSAVTLSATPDEGSTFTGWGGACSGIAACEVTMDAAKSVTAIFTLDTHYNYLPILIK